MKRSGTRSVSAHGLVLDAGPFCQLRDTLGAAAFFRWLARAEAELADEIRAIVMALADHDHSRAASGCKAISMTARQVGAEGLRTASETLERALPSWSGALPALAPEIRHMRNEARLLACSLKDLRLLVSDRCDSSAQLVR